MTNCVDCINFTGTVCVLEGKLTEEDRIKATQGRCPYYAEDRKKVVG